VSDSTSSSVIVSVSPFGFATVHSPSRWISVFGAFIQLSGLYAPPSAWIATQPSPFTMMSRTASGRCAFSRPA
jgi:hypothetical protein